MPELRGRNIVFNTYPIDISTIPYRDKTREKQRLARLEQKVEGEGGKSGSSNGLMMNHKKSGGHKGQTVAWSQKKERLERKIKRRETKERKRLYLATLKQQQQQQNSSNDNSSNSNNNSYNSNDQVVLTSRLSGNKKRIVDMDEWEELAKEEREYKKRRKGKSGLSMDDEELSE